MIETFRENRRLVIFIVGSTFLLYAGFNLWQSLFNNFAVEEIGVGAAGVGWIQSVREVPGLMGFLLGFIALYLSEARIMTISTLLLGAGILLTGQSQTMAFLLFSTVIMSIGFHFFYPCSNSLALMSVRQGITPKFLGQLSSLGALASVVATGTVYLFAERLGYRTLFFGAGILIMIAGILLAPFGTSRDGLPVTRKVTLRRRYWLYYTLSVLTGSRRHISNTFAIFLLVKQYGIPVQTTATLYLVTSLINTYAMQYVGRLIGRFGERTVMTVEFILLAGIFLCYAYVPILPVLYVLFVFDQVLFGLSMALSTYFQKIAVTKEEITSNVSVESTTNHLAAVIIPVIGGTIWELYGARAPFLFGVGLAIVSLVLVQFIRVKPAAAPAPARAS